MGKGTQFGTSAPITNLRYDRRLFVNLVSLCPTTFGTFPREFSSLWHRENDSRHRSGVQQDVVVQLFDRTIDGHFLAVDCRTGKELWSFPRLPRHCRNHGGVLPDLRRSARLQDEVRTGRPRSEALCGIVLQSHI